MRRQAEKRRRTESALGVATSLDAANAAKPNAKGGPEWRMHLNSIVQGAAHPLRHTFVVGETLPWILNPRTKAPFGVTCTFALLSLIFSVTAVPDNVYRAASRALVSFKFRFFRPRLDLKYRRGDGLGTSQARRQV